MVLHVGPKAGLRFAAMFGFVALSSCAGPEAKDGARASAFGATIVLDFETDAAGVPLTRGTVLAEQYAAWGIHFTGGYAIGAQSVDFPDYKATHGNMLCTAIAAVQPDFPASPWTGQRCFPGDPASGVPLGITLDFPACEVAIGMFPLVQSPPPIGQYTITGSMLDGTPVPGMINDTIEPIFPAGSTEMVTPAVVPSDFHQGPGPHAGANIQIVTLTAGSAGALDNVLIVPCGDGGLGGAAGQLGTGGGGAGGQGGSGAGIGTGTAGRSGSGGSPGSGGTSATGGATGGGGVGGGSVAGHPATGTGGAPTGTGGHDQPPGSGGTSAGGTAGGSGGQVAAGGNVGTGAGGTAGHPEATGGAAGAAAPGGGGSAGHPTSSGGAAGTSSGAGGKSTGGTGGHPGPTSGCSYGSAQFTDSSTPPWYALAALALAIRRRRQTASR